MAAVRVFLGITGASGAPYAARLLEASPAAGCEVGLCASRAGLEVIATELYGDARLSRDETLARFTEPARDAVTVHDPQDWRAPYASGSAKVDAYVICPCSMGTLGTIASGAMSNLIHRAASVALKEGRSSCSMPARDAALDDPPREHARGAAGGRDRALPGAGLLPRGGERWTISSTSSSGGASTSSGSRTRCSSAGGRGDGGDAARSRPTRCGRCSTASRRSTT